MCGILGGWQPFWPERAAVREGLASIVHRGPDGSGEYYDEGVFLGVRRLAIIDIEGGSQPISNEDESVAVAFNGEIYNYLEVRNQLISKGHKFQTESDTEVLVHLYEDYRASMLERLRGMFAFAIWDKRRRLLLLGRDRFGKKPLYYVHHAPDVFLFASEIKALRPLMAAAGIKCRIREQSVYDFLSFGVVPQPDTIYQGVLTVPPGSYLVFDGKDITIKPYWTIDYAVKTRCSYPEAVERVRWLISESVRLRLRSDVPLGVFLSGGMDSSVIAYEASRLTDGAVNTFTVAMKDAQLDESSVAARTARKFETRHHVLHLDYSPVEELVRVVRQYDQPYSDSSAIPSLAVSRLAREHVTVVLNGDGGDEVFAGYRRYLAARIGELLRRLPRVCIDGLMRSLGHMQWNRRTVLGFVRRFFRGLPLPPGERYLVWTSDMLLEHEKKRIWRNGPMQPTEDWIESILPQDGSLLDGQLYGDIHINLLSDLLVKMDMATSAASLEARSPLLDHTVAEFTASLPDAYRVRRGRLKALLRDAYRKELPREVLDGPKRGFEVPLASWLVADLRELLMDTFNGSSLRISEYLDPSFVYGIVDHQTPFEGNRAYLVYALLVLELWLRDFG